MKKGLFSIAVLLVFALGFTSCGDDEQCTECIYTLNNVPIPNEFCGTKEEVKTFEAEVETSAAAAGAQAGETPTVVCTKK